MLQAVQITIGYITSVSKQQSSKKLLLLYFTKLLQSLYHVYLKMATAGASRIKHSLRKVRAEEYKHFFREKDARHVFIELGEL